MNATEALKSLIKDDLELWEAEELGVFVESALMKEPTAPIPQGKLILCGECRRPLPVHFTYDYCPFCGTKIDGGIDCRKIGEKK